MATPIGFVLTLDGESKVVASQRNVQRGFEMIGASTEAASRRASAGLSRLGSAVAGVAAGIAAASSLRKFIDETISAEKEQAQLAAVLMSTGYAAGFSQERLNAMAEQMARATNFSAGEITTAQARLLSYTGVMGEQFPRAMQAAANMAQRMGIDLASAAEQVGRALDVPSQGLTALTRQGFRFSQEQKQLIEQLERTGKVAQAQEIILDALGSSYGGAAEAARDTLGGALTALQKNINNLMTGEGGGITRLRGGIEDVNTALSSSQTREAFQTFLGWMATTSAEVIKGAANLLTFMQSANKLSILAGTDAFGKMKADAADLSAHIERLTDMAQRYQESIDRGFNVQQNQRNLERTRQKIAELQTQAMAASQRLKDFASNSVTAAVAPVLGPDLKPGKRPAISTPAISTPGIRETLAAENKAALAMAKAAADDLVSIYTGSEAIMEQARRAGLIDEGQYYQAKLSFIDLNIAAKQRELQQESAILAAQKLGGKDAIERDSKIAANKIKINTLTQEGAMKAEALALQASTALNAQAASLRAAEQAAGDYLRTMQLGFERTTAAVGMGSASRDIASARQQIQDRYAKQRQDLANQRALAELGAGGELGPEAQAHYDKLLAISTRYERLALTSYTQGVQARLDAEADWRNGATRAWEDYASTAANVAQQTADAFGSAFRGMEDSIVNFAVTGKGSFKDLATSIVSDLVRIQVRAAASGIFSNIAEAMGLGSKIVKLDWNSIPAAPNARGGVYSSPSLSQYRNQVHDTPQFFTFARGGVFAEAGPEAIMPLSRAPDGSLGVRASGAGGGDLVVNVHNYAGAQIEQRSSRDASGRQVLDLFVRQAVGAVADQLASDSGPVGAAMRGRDRLGM